MFKHPWKYIISVHHLKDLPDADRPEYAFVGRSNVGKSSLLNAVTKQKGLAKTSSTPGRTQALNFFEPTSYKSKLYLVDLPGYGFAKAPKNVVKNWQALLKDYLRGRPTLHRLFLLVDSRHGLKKVDEEILMMLDEAAVTYQVVLTKIDKIKESSLKYLCEKTTEILKKHPAAFPEILATSSQKNKGINTVQRTLEEMQKCLT